MPTAASRLSRFLTSIFGPCLGALLGVSAPGAPAPPLTPDQWAQDVDALATQLPRLHKNAFFHCPRERFEDAGASLKADLPTLSPDATLGRLRQLGAMIGDAHTSVDWSPLTAGWSMLPVSGAVFSDGVLITHATPDHQDLVGSVIESVDGLAMDEIRARVGTLYAWENESWRDVQFRQHFPLAQALVALGVLGDPASASLVVRAPDGARLGVKVGTIPVTGGGSMTAPERALAGVASVSLTPRTRAYWIDAIPGTTCLYLRYDRCADTPELTVNAFIAEANARLETPGWQRLIVDLRFNSGGNSALLAPFIDGLRARKELHEPGRLILLIGRNTFSSGQLNASQIERVTGCVTMGQPTGQKPNAYGEIKSFELPNSRLKVYYSTKYFRTDGADPPSMMPDVLIPLTCADYLAGRDATLEAGVAYEPAR